MKAYPILLIPEDEGGYSATHPDLDGCLAQGETVQEALQDLAQARKSWIAVCKDQGIPVPPPPTHDALLARLPRRVRALRRALENVRALAAMAKVRGRFHQKDVDHLLRFCQEGGIVSSPLRARTKPKPRTAAHPRSLA
jgi:predicted RNase H-like HicB family nuclease